MIIKLNVGGKTFHTSQSTLEWIPGTFFTALLSDNIPSERDEAGAYFIDRDPELFALILQFLRTKQFTLLESDRGTVNKRLICELLHECEFYGILPLIERLHYLKSTFSKEGGSNSDAVGGFMCGYDAYNQGSSNCGDIHFNGVVEYVEKPRPGGEQRGDRAVQSICVVQNYIAVGYETHALLYRLSESTSFELVHRTNDIGVEKVALSIKQKNQKLILATASGTRVSLWILDESPRQDLLDPSHPQFDQLSTASQSTDIPPRDPQDVTFARHFTISVSVIKAMEFVYGNLIVIGEGGAASTADSSSVASDGTAHQAVDEELEQNSTVLGIWNAVNQQWVQQRVTDCAKFTTWQLNERQMVVFGTEAGELKTIDMEKLPRRVVDSSIMISELAVDAKSKAISAISGRIIHEDGRILRGYPPFSVEVAYGTVDGRIVVMASQPEKSSADGIQYKYGLSVAYSFQCHQRPVCSILLGARYLISMCDEYHVRSFLLTRFRGKLSNQAKPVSSFQVGPLVNLNQKIIDDTVGPHTLETSISDAIFIQKCCTTTNELFIRLANTGERVCRIKSVRSRSNISTVCLVDCTVSPGRLGSQSRRLLLTGHDTGHLEVWDLEPSIDRLIIKDRTRISGPSNASVGLTTVSGALPSQPVLPGGPKIADLLRLLDRFENASMISDSTSLHSQFSYDV